MAMRRSSAGVWVSLLLVAVTLSVFSRMQYFGPESTLRLFHEAILDGDEAGVDRLADPDLRSPVTAGLVGQVSAILAAGGKYRLVQMNREPGLVVAEVVYSFPSGQSETMAWILRRSGRAWHVDCSLTFNYLRTLLRRR